MDERNSHSNLPPAEGPFDEEEPLIIEDDEQKNARKYFVMGTTLLVTVILLFISTVAFAALYFNLLRLDRARLPRWPKPSISPLGKYAKAAVAADNEYCSDIGRNTLLAGGNAVDAAIASMFCIGIMDSHSSGLGGGHFLNFYNATERKCHVIDAREVAPLAATEEMYKGHANMSKYGWKAVAVPGEIHGLYTAFSRFGSRKVGWKSLLQPSIELLSNGYPTSSALAGALLEKLPYILNEPTMKPFINPKTKKIYKIGEQITTRQNLLKTLKLLAESSNPIETFYDSNFTQQLVDEFTQHGGILTRDDFKRYQSIERGDEEVIMMKLANGRSICGLPPPSSSAVAMAILNIMDGFQNQEKSFADVSTLFHRFVEASKFAFAGRTWLGDMNFVKNATDVAHRLTQPEWATWARNLITDKTHPDSYYGGDFNAMPDDHGTTHISVIDKHGNVVSITSTINLFLGAVVMSPSSGILWNDEMDDFSTPGQVNAFGYPPSPANFIVPRKRPMSSMSPLIIFDDNEKHKVFAVGAAGGSTIISSVAGAALHALWLDANVKEALDAPRLHNQLRPNVTQYEPNFPKAYVRALEARGHNMVKVKNISVVTAVERDADGQIYANSDYRKGQESAPAGY